MKKKQTHSIARATLGAQSTAYDFAYTDEKYFTTRTWYAYDYDDRDLEILINLAYTSNETEE